MDAGTLSPAQIEALGLALMQLERTIAELARRFGLDPGELDHLFERFYRGHTARQLAPGTGMGLAITRGLLAAVGGRVWAENIPGAGARFTLVIPGPQRPMGMRS